MAIFQKLGQFLTEALTWLRSTYSESDGSGSSTRFHIFLLTAFVISVGVSFAILVFHKVITVEQFDTFLSSAATFLISTCGPLYGINKLADWANTNSTAGQKTTPPVVPPTA